MSNEDKARLYGMLRRLSRQMHRFSHKVEQNQEYFNRQSAMLQLIAQNDGIIQRDLAERMDMRPSSMTEALVKMEQLNLIRRRQDEKDQRLMHIYLTDAGRDALEKALKTAEEFTNALFSGLSEDEIQEMLSITSKLCGSLDAMNSGDPDDWDEECFGHPHHHCGEEKRPHHFI